MDMPTAPEARTKLGEGGTLAPEAPPALPVHAHKWPRPVASQIPALIVAAVLATSFLGQTVGAWFKHPETPTLIFLGTSLPQFFLAGYSWPREAIPEAVQAAANVFPADLTIDGMVRLNQMGASLSEVSRDWRGLWCLAIVYFTLAVVSATLVQRRQAAHGQR